MYIAEQEFVYWVGSGRGSKNHRFLIVNQHHQQPVNKITLNPKPQP